MTTTANLAARLESLIGAHRVVTAEPELLEFAVDGMVPGAIVRPNSAPEVAEVVRFAISEKLSIIPSGSRSKLGIGMPPTRYDIALDMTGLHEIAHYDAADLTLSVDAGLPLRQLASVLAEKGQFLPLFCSLLRINHRRRNGRFRHRLHAAQSVRHHSRFPDWCGVC